MQEPDTELIANDNSTEQLHRFPDTHFSQIFVSLYQSSTIIFKAPHLTAKTFQNK